MMCQDTTGPPKRPAGSPIGFGHRCQYRAKFTVTAGQTSIKVCGVHARYYREIGDEVKPL